ncbi:MAG: bifunctional UDP-N-acetylglucosamine diphosphorylase/glucosamine-1-phosphate N-acetyltransferase GlmU [Planctomycetota bacterium]|jgi:bifunctional UDP-N-acetylglucosamine pyrophosphorylase/glucosamine-1-phosphate N-acetyltransferase
MTAASESSSPQPRVGAVAILAAGQGTRMRSPLPKVLHPICGRSMLGWVLAAAHEVDPRRVIVVVGDHNQDALEQEARAEWPGDPEALEFAVQSPQLGTGHALQVCAGSLADLAQDEAVLVLYGDMPALTPESLRELVRARPAGGAALLTAVLDDPTGYGRILRDDRGGVTGIVEQKDASPEQLAISETNVGVYALPGGDLPERLGRLSNDNAQGEYYLTDLVADYVGDGVPVAPMELEDVREAGGVNTLAQLSAARATCQERLLLEHLAAGVFIEDPETTYIDVGVEIGAGSRILPCTVIRRGVTVGEQCEVGPFTHLRVGTVLDDRAEVGNFTETKKARLGSGTKAKHLAYLGDVTIGAKANIGAGTIVANYDGVNKHPTQIGDRAFIGSGSVLIAPTDIGAGALTGGGAVLTPRTKVPAGTVWVGVPARELPGKESGRG